jgi:hypothetical protein
MGPMATRGPHGNQDALEDPGWTRAPEAGTTPSWFLIMPAPAVRGARHPLLAGCMSGISRRSTRQVSTGR